MTTLIFVSAALIFIVLPFLGFIPQLSGYMNKVTLKSKIFSIIFGILIFISKDTMFYAAPGEYYLVQYIWGTQTVVMTPGPHFKFWGDLIKFKKVITIKQSKEKGHASRVVGAINVRFNDSVTAEVSLASRFQMPSDENAFKTLAIEYRSQENLIDNSLVPMTKQIARNAARLVSAQEYISGKGGEFEFALRDQMENGQYQLKTTEITSKRITESILKKDRKVESDKVARYKVEVVSGKDGHPVRLPLVTTKYLIALTDLNVEEVDMDDTFDARLDEQRKAAAEGNIAKQKAQKAEYDKQRIVAEGERDKAEERAKQEKEQVTILISAETELKKAEIEKKRKAIQLEAAKLDAKTKKTLADAEAYQKQAVMKADGALEVKLKALIEINQAYANALSKHSQIVPTTVIGGQSKQGNSAMDLISLLTAKTAKDLSVDLSPKKTN